MGLIKRRYGKDDRCPKQCRNLKSTVFWFVTPYSSERARRFGGKYRLHLHCQSVSKARNQRMLYLPITSSVSCLFYSSTLEMEGIYSETSGYLQTRRN
jgi:hypothetical protein